MASATPSSSLLFDIKTLPDPLSFGAVLSLTDIRIVQALAGGAIVTGMASDSPVIASTLFRPTG